MIGYVGAEGKGLGGIEAAYNSTISGQAGEVLIETDGHHNIFATRVKRAPIDGATSS